MEYNELNTIALHYQEHKDERSYNILYKNLKHRIYFHMKGYLKDDSKTNDAVTMLFLKLITKIHLWNPDKAAITTWLIRIAKNDCISILKNEVRTSSIEEMAEYGTEFAKDVNDIDDHSYEDLKYTLTLEAIGSLKPMYRIPLQLSLSGVIFKDISTKLDISIQSVKNRVSRAKKMVKAAVNKQMQ